MSLPLSREPWDIWHLDYGPEELEDHQFDFLHGHSLVKDEKSWVGYGLNTRPHQVGSSMLLDFNFHQEYVVLVFIWVAWSLVDAQLLPFLLLSSYEFISCDQFDLGLVLHPTEKCWHQAVLLRQTL